MLTKTPKPQALQTPTDLSQKDASAIAKSINGIVADLFALYFKTKNFHWHMSGPHFRDYHLLLDEQAEQIYATIDPLAERVRKLGQRTLTSLGSTAKLTRVEDNDEAYVEPGAMLLELMEDNKSCAAAMRAAHSICDDADDSGSAGLLETFIDETERRTWFLFEAGRDHDSSGIDRTSNLLRLALPIISGSRSMSSAEIDSLRRLHTDSVDSMDGYTEALEDSDANSVFDLFDEMVEFHRAAASQLADELIKLGEEPKYSGSFLSTVHKSIMKLRSLVGGLDGSVLPGLIDGEERSLAKYDEALASGGLGSSSTTTVEKLRERLAAAIAKLRVESMDHKIADLSNSK